MSNIRFIHGASLPETYPPQPVNPYRDLLEQGCTLSPRSLLRVMKRWLAEKTEQKRKGRKERDAKTACKGRHYTAAYCLENGVSRELVRRWQRAIEEAWALDVVEIPVFFSASELARLKPLAKARHCSVVDLAQQGGTSPNGKNCTTFRFISY